MSNNNTYDKNADIPSGGEDSNLPNTGSEHKMDLDACDDKWMKYFNADIFEPYSPSDPFFIHSLLKNLDKHRQMLERRDNDVDFVGSNNIAVIPQAFEELSLDNKTLDHTYDQGYDDNAIANHSNNVDLDSYNIHNTPFDIEQTNGSFRGPLNTPFVDAFHKSCAIQHLAAETADSASPLDLQSAARVDTNGMSPSSFFFDQSTMKLLAQYFGIDDEPQLPVNDVQLTQGLECIDPLLLNPSMHCVQHNQDQEHVDHMLMNPEHLVEQGKSDVRMMVPDICNKDPNRHESHRRGLLGQW